MFSRSGDTNRLLRRMLDVRKRKKSKMAQNEETSLITDRCLIQQEVLYGVYLKDVSMTQRIFSQMLLSYLHFVDPTTVFCYAIWFRKRPIHYVALCLHFMSTCSWIPKNCIKLAVRILYRSRTKLVYFILFLFQVGRHHVSCARLYFPGYYLSTYFWLMAAIFDFSLIRTSDSLRSSLVVSTDLENMGTAVGILLLAVVYRSRDTRYFISTSG